MKISLLGTNGFLSNAIGSFYQQKNCILDMYGLERPLYHSFSNFIKVDFANAHVDITKLSDSDVIVYAIGAGIQSNKKDEAHLIYHLNVTVPISICVQLKTIGYKGIFVTFGSYFEMGSTTIRHPFSECEIISSISHAPNDYTVSKRLLTRFASSFEHNFAYWHFILPTIYGKGENPQRIIPYTINAIRSKSKYFFTSGSQVRQYIHVNEIPIILDKSIRHSIPSGIYNVGGCETLTVYQLVTLLHKSLGCIIPDGCFNKIQRADEDMQYLALDGTKLSNTIAHTPSLDIQSSIQEYL